MLPGLLDSEPALPLALDRLPPRPADFPGRFDEHPHIKVREGVAVKGVDSLADDQRCGLNVAVALAAVGME